MQTITKCEYYETLTGWAYRAWYNGTRDYSVWQYWSEPAVAFQIDAPTAFYKLIQHLTGAGYAVACMPEMVENNS
jgi:hypothetical protein